MSNPNKFRLLFTISEFTYSSQVRNLVDLVSQLDRDTFDIEIGALQIGDDAVELIRLLDVPFFQFRLQPTRPLRISDLWIMFKSPLKLVSGCYDLVHSLLYQSIFTEAYMVKHLTNAKYIYTKSNLEWNNHPHQWRRKSQYSDVVVSLSQATSDLLSQKGFEERTEKIFLGIDTDHFVEDLQKKAALRNQLNIPHDAFVFGCAAQFIELKEHVTVVKAFEKLHVRYPNIFLLFCGPNHRDEYYQSCIEYIDQSPARDRIHMLGHVKDMPAFYSAIDCFTLASRYEAFGYVYVEAMSCAKPTIACPVGGPVEIIRPGETGLFVNVSDPDNLAEKMEFYVADPRIAKTHGRAARARAIKVFSKQVMANNYHNLYMRLLTDSCACT